MLDPQILKNELDVFKNNIKRRGLNVDVDLLISMNEERKALRFEAENKRSEQKELGKQIALSSPEEKENLLEQASLLSDEVKKLFEQVEQIDKAFFDKWIKIPNLISKTSPDGKTDSDNLELKKVGDIKDFKSPKSHIDIGEKLGLIDVQKAAEVSGSCLLYTSPSPRDLSTSRMPSSA